MPALELEFEVYCACGEGLCQQTTEGRTRGRGMPFITVTPCEKCMERARDEGYSMGYGEGLDEGREQGYSKGYDQGCLDTEESSDDA